MPSVGAVVPTYNSAPYIEKTLLSLCKQSLPLSEIIVVDDASTDNTVDIVLSLSERYKSIKLICLSANSGPSIARNCGLDIINTDLVLFMDADDITDSRLVEKEYQRLQELKSVSSDNWVLCHSAYSIIDSSGKLITPIIRWKQIYPEETLGYQFVRNHILTSSGVLVRKTVVLNVGGFDPLLKFSQDYDLWLRLASYGGFAYVDEPLVQVRRHMNNTSRRLSNVLYDEKTILSKYPLDIIEGAIYKRHLPWWVNASDFVSILYRLDYWDRGYAIIQEVVNKKSDYANGFFFLGLYYLHVGVWKEAANCFIKTIELEPNNGAALNNLGALLALDGKADEAISLLTKAIELFPGYLDAGNNLENLKQGQLNFENVRFTWRELRPVLTRYQE